VKTITSRQNPLVTSFRTARSECSPRRHLLLDGIRLIDDAQATKIPIEVALFSATALRAGDRRLTKLADTLARSGSEVLAASESVIEAVSPVRKPSGVVALATYRAYPLDRIITEVGSGLVVAAVGVQDPGNVGAIIRAADGGSARAVIATGGSADPFGWRALRGAMGSSLRLPVAIVDDLPALIVAARERGAKVVATVPRGGAGLYETDLTGPRLLLVGQEGAGLEHTVNSSADLRVSIPMQRQVDSLNVSIAAALIIYEARRQTLRRRRGGDLRSRSQRRNATRSDQ
jgi:TrmH family RNA methyltransferase